MRILILGGTGFIGPFFVRAGVTRGHDVSVFNRGKGITEFPPVVERLTGDRNANLASITKRDWDAVVDLAAYEASWVRRLGEVLGNFARHYTFISSVAVYKNPPRSEDTDEGGVLLEAAPEAASTLEKYGAAKVHCEREAQTQFPGRTLILRPAYIAGPADPNGALTYWPVRMAEGGEALAAGSPLTAAQFIDVRDLASWAIRLIECQITGIYNAVGPHEPLRLVDLVHAAREAAFSSTTIAWVASDWLASQGKPETWDKILWWSFEPGGIASLMRMNGDRARAQGLVTRSPATTLRDTLYWYRQQPAESQVQLIPGRKDGGKASTSAIDIDRSWRQFLARERTVLRAWRTRWHACK